MDYDVEPYILKLNTQVDRFIEGATGSNFGPIPQLPKRNLTSVSTSVKSVRPSSIKEFLDP
jgi:hypothetical protein